MQKPTVHLICNAHLDPVWQWRWEEGCAETLATFTNAVRLLEEHPGLIFNHNESVLYRWIMEYQPALFRHIQRLVKMERWHISGGWYLQPDVNLPGSEALIRHIVEGRQFFKAHFQAEPVVAYNFDSFGHSGGLPQILQLAGYKMYIHLRPQHPDLQIPSDLYRWQGVDGSEIIGYRIAVGLYHTEFENIEQRLQEGVNLAVKSGRDVPVFWGIGNHGGGATREDLKIIDRFIATDHGVRIIHSTPEYFYDAIKKMAAKAPVVKGDLQRVFTGCYTSLSRLKRGTQESLHQLLQTETLHTAGWWQLGQKYEEDLLANSWRDHLFNDFHDILPGSCIEPAERDALDLYGKVSETTRKLRLATAVAYNRFPAEPAYLPITILNSNPGMTRMPVEVECMISHRPKWSGSWFLRLYDMQGKEIACQEEQPEALLPFNGWRRKLCFMADLPAIGAAHYRAAAVEGEKSYKEIPAALQFEFDKTLGLIHHLGDDHSPNYLAGALLKPLVIKDDGDSWGTDKWQYREVLGEFKADPDSFQIIEKGPVRCIYQSIFHYNHSQIRLNTLLYSDLPILEFGLRVSWNEERKRLKLSIPTVFRTERVLCDIPGGIIHRPADGEEHVHGRWLLVGSEDGKAGIAIINSGQHGFDFQDGEVRLSVLRSAAYCHEQGFRIEKYPARKFMDQGIHEFRLLVTVGKYREVLSKMSALADWLTMPPVSYAHLPFGEPVDPGSPAASIDPPPGLFTLSDPGVRLLACKRSRDGKDLIIRLQENTGQSCKTDLRLFTPAQQISLSFKPLEIKTIRIDKSGKWREVHLIREE